MNDFSNSEKELFFYIEMKPLLVQIVCVTPHSLHVSLSEEGVSLIFVDALCRCNTVMSSP